MTAHQPNLKAAKITGGVHSDTRHDSAHKHVTGDAELGGSPKNSGAGIDENLRPANHVGPRVSGDVRDEGSRNSFRRKSTQRRHGERAIASARQIRSIAARDQIREAIAIDVGRRGSTRKHNRQSWTRTKRAIAKAEKHCRCGNAGSPAVDKVETAVQVKVRRSDANPVGSSCQIADHRGNGRSQTNRLRGKGAGKENCDGVSPHTANGIRGGERP